MKKSISFLLCLAFLSLACLGSGAASSANDQSLSVAERTLTNTPAPGASTSAPTLTATPNESRCAVVIADQSLHLRRGASEDAEVLTWLKSGDVLVLISNSDPDWWRVRFEGFEGFARSIYLQESECVK